MKVLVIGRDGQLARALAQLQGNTIEIVTAGRPELDLLDLSTIDTAIGRHRPDIVVNTAAYTLVDQAEREAELAFAVNRDGAGHVAAATARAHLPLIHISTDYVFDGSKPEPYREDDEPRPQSVYGKSKRAGEGAVLDANPQSAVIRTSWVYSPWGRNFALTMLRLAAEREVVRVVADQIGSPTYAPDLASAILVASHRLASAPDDTNLHGIFHATNAGATSWAGFAEEIFLQSAARGGPSARVEPISTADYPTAARRPANSRLSGTRFLEAFGHRAPMWQDGTSRLIRAIAGSPTAVWRA